MTELEQANAEGESPPDCPPEKAFVPLNLCNRILEMVHNFPSSGHPGITATIKLLQNRFWFPSLPKDTTQFVK